jgi:hypothetical protein
MRVSCRTRSGEFSTRDTPAGFATSALTAVPGPLPDSGPGGFPRSSLTVTSIRRQAALTSWLPSPGCREC